MAVPAMPGAGLVVIEPKLGFCGLETVLDGPAMAFDADQGGDVGSRWTPGRKRRRGRRRRYGGGSEDRASKGRSSSDRIRRRRDRPVRNRPSHAAARLWCPRRRTDAARPKDQALARSPRRFQPPAASRTRSRNDGWRQRQAHSPCRAAQRHLDVANAIDAIGGNPGKRHARQQRALDHSQRKRGFGRKTGVGRHMRRGHPGFIAGPALGQIKLPVDKGMPGAKHTRQRRRSGSS